MKIPGLITKLFEMKGIKTIADLKPEEKAEYDRWQLIMDGAEMTVEKIKAFCKAQVNVLEEQFANPENTDKKDAYLKASLHIYATLLKVIEAPEKERADLERHLVALINQKSD